MISDGACGLAFTHAEPIRARGLVHSGRSFSHISSPIAALSATQHLNEINTLAVIRTDELDTRRGFVSMYDMQR